MLFIIEIAWMRHSRETGRPDTGTTTYAEFARTLTGAKRKATEKFRRHYGGHLIALSAREKQDPAGIYTPENPVRRDCGSGHDFGICPTCNQGHGFVVLSR